MTIDGKEAKETYAIMDMKNKSIMAKDVTSTDANKAKMRALAKACSQHGLALFFVRGRGYAGRRQEGAHWSGQRS